MKGYHVAVVSPLSPFGQRVRRLIDEGDFPAIELKLFDPTLESISTLTQFQGEVLGTQPIDADLLPSVDVMFVGEGTGQDVLALVASVAREGVLTFVADKAGLSVPIAAHGFERQVSSCRCADGGSSEHRLHPDRQGIEQHRGLVRHRAGIGYRHVAGFRAR